MKNSFIKFVSAFFLSIFMFLFALPASTVSALIISPPNFDFGMAPGTQYNGEFMVFFGEDFPDKLYLYVRALDFVGENADLVYVDENLNANTLANWIILDRYEIDKPAVLFQQNEDHIIRVKFTVTVPTNAPVGAHYAGIVLSAKAPENAGDNGSNVAISKEEILQFYLNVEGEQVLDASLKSFDTVGGQRLFTTLPVTFETRFTNKGNIYMTPTGNIEIEQGDNKIYNVNLNPFGSRVFAGKDRLYTNHWLEGVEVDKLSLTDIEANLQSQPKNFFEKVFYQITHFKIGMYKAELAGYIGAQPPYRSEVTFYVIPIELFITIAGIILIAVIYFKVSRSRNSNKGKSKSKSKSVYDLK